MHGPSLQAPLMEVDHSHLFVDLGGLGATRPAEAHQLGFTRFAKLQKVDAGIWAPETF